MTPSFREKSSENSFNPFKSAIFIFVCVISVIRIPNYIDQTANDFLKYLSLALTFISVIFYLKRGHISKTFILILLYWLFLSFSTLLNNGDFPQLIHSATSSILLAITIECGFEYSKTKTLKATMLALGIITIISSITMYIFYAKNPLLRGMYIDKGGDSNYYFLGQDNGTIFYTLPSVLIAALYGIAKHKKIPLYVFLYTIFVGGSYLYVFSGAGIVSYVILLLAEIIVNYPKIQKKIYKYLTPNIILIIFAIFFLMIVVLQSNNFLIEQINLLLHKDNTFTGRTRLWEIVTALISSQPLLGYGFETSAIALSKIPYGKAHNMLLQITYNGGIVASLIYFLIFKHSLSNRHPNLYQVEKTLLSCFVLLILLISNFDFYIYHPLTFLPFIFYSAYDNKKSPSSLTTKESS